MSWLPCPQFILCIIQDLLSLLTHSICWVRITGYDRSVVQETDESPALLGQENLLLGTLDGGGEVEVVGFLEFLAGLRWVSISRRRFYACRCCSRCW